MKKLILILVLIVSFTLTAQDKVVTAVDNTKDLSNTWMTKIASNSEMRVKIMDMIIEKTAGNEEEMMKLVNSIVDNPELYNMITAVKNKNRRSNIISLEPRGMMKDSTEAGKDGINRPMKMYNK